MGSNAYISLSKSLVALGLTGSLALFSLNSSADSILGVYAGAGVWNGSFDGDFLNGVGVNTDQLGIDSEANAYAYIALEHFIPVLPNIRLSVMDLSTDASTTTDAFSFDGTEFPDGAQTNTSVDLSHTDVILYWQLLDNWVNLDLGITARTFDGEIEIDGSANGVSVSESVSFKGTAPLGYAKAKFELPFTGWFVGGTLHYIAVSGNSFTDVETNIGYTHDGLVLDVGFELGYRSMTVETDDLGSLETDLTIDGPYAALTIHF